MSFLSLQVLGQCKGVISAVVSVLCFHNVVPALGWCGYSVTVGGCLLYGRCKVHSRMQASMSKHLHKSSTYNLQYFNSSVPTSAAVTPRTPEQEERERILTGDGGRRTAPVFRIGALDETAATTQDLESTGSGNGRAPRGLMGSKPKAMDAPGSMGGDKYRNWALSYMNTASSLWRSVQVRVQFTPPTSLQLEVAADAAAYNTRPLSAAVH